LWKDSSISPFLQTPWHQQCFLSGIFQFKILLVDSQQNGLWWNCQEFHRLTLSGFLQGCFQIWSFHLIKRTCSKSSNFNTPKFFDQQIPNTRPECLTHLVFCQYLSCQFHWLLKWNLRELVPNHSMFVLSIETETYGMWIQTMSWISSKWKVRGKREERKASQKFLYEIFILFFAK